MRSISELNSLLFLLFHTNYLVINDNLKVKVEASFWMGKGGGGGGGKICSKIPCLGEDFRGSEIMKFAFFSPFLLYVLYVARCMIYQTPLLVNKV